MGFFAPQLGNIFLETQPGEAGREPRAERCTGTTLLLDGIAEDLADFLLHAVPMAARPDLQLGFHIIIQVSDQ